VGVLNGGYRKWTEESHPLSQETPAYRRADFEARVRPGLRVEAPDVLTAVADPAVQIVDARGPETYRGEVYRGSRRGHIASAINVPAKSLYHDDGTWLSDQALAGRFAEAGLDPNGSVISYCNGGVTATAVLFALDRIGHRRYSNYDGSLNEWGERSELPVEEGNGE
jgi:thiosulfate/3-mercaptopyruvate sulfurtransferase